MQEPTKKKVDPVIDQKIVKDKKSNWLWWLLALLLIALLLYWLMNRDDNVDRNPQPSAPAPATSQVQPNASPAATRDTNNTVTPAPTSPTAPVGSEAGTNIQNTQTGNPADNATRSSEHLSRYFSGDQSESSEWYELDSVIFESGNATPRIEDEAELREVVRILNDNPDKIVVIQGFTDSTGSPEANEKLSMDRATAIKNWLTEQGVDASRLTVEGKGAANPVADNQSNAGREQNRRVAIKVLAHGESEGD